MAFSGIPLPKVVGDVGPGGPFITTLNALNDLNMKKLKNKYYGPNIESQMSYRNALTEGQNISNKYKPEELELANAFNTLRNKYYGPNIESEMSSRDAVRDINKFKLKHPGLLAGGDAATVAALDILEHGNNNNQNNNQNNPQVIPFNDIKPPQDIPGRVVNSENYQNNGQTKQDNSLNIVPAIKQSPEQTLNKLIQSPQIPTNPQNQLMEINNQRANSQNQIMDMPISKKDNISYRDLLKNSMISKLKARNAEAELNQKRADGYSWGQLTAEAKNSLTALGYGMGIDPVKMKKYVSDGLSIKQIAEKEGLDPDNLPAPIYPPTTATKSRVQQVEQVSAELDYLSSKATALIKPFANTYGGYSGKAFVDQFSSDPAKQREFGRYLGALGVYTGIAGGRNILEGGKPGITLTKMIKDASLKGIHDIHPMRLTDEAFQAMQDTIDQLLKSGAKIRTTTGMSPFSKINSEDKGENIKTNKAVTKKWKMDAQGNLVEA